MKPLILVVQHDAKSLDLYERWLQDMGALTIGVSDGGQAMQTLRTEQVDGLLLDLDVPVMNGLAMLSQLRQRFADIPVMVVADVESTDSLLEALESGAQDYLTKPATHAVFVQKCRKMFFGPHESGQGVRNREEDRSYVNTRILIVDDERDLRLLLKALLESQGYDCEEAHTGQEGLEKILEGDFGLVLLDYQMPALDGIQVLQALSSVSSRMVPPVIMMTANTRADLWEKAIRAGVKEILSKPFELDSLLLAIGRTLKDAPSPSPCSQGPP